MKTITEQLADALRVVAAGNTDYENLQEVAREALAAYDAQQAEPTVIARADGQELVGHDWDNGPQAWDVIRTDGDEWLCLADPEHSARIVQCVNAHDALVSALRTILADKGSASFNDDLEAYDAAIQTASDALAQAGVTP